MASSPGQLTYSIRDQWVGGYIADVYYTPTSTVNGWRVELSFDGDIANAWNSQVVAHVGNTYVLENVGYNATLLAGETVKLGFQATGADTTIDFVTTGGGSGTGSGGTVPPAPPALVLKDVSASEGNPAAAPPAGGSASLMGPLHTSGNQILNADNKAVNIEAVNWFGLETAVRAPHGLHIRNWQDMMDEMKELGFNAIRLPFSLDAVLKPSTPNGIDFNLNPDLRGLGSLAVLDKIVDYAEDIGLGIILDNHRSAAGDGPNPSGLWYDAGYTEADWLSAWRLLADRYGSSPAIIGADLINEPHAATWSALAAAAERAGNAILAKAPDWLIVVEGTASYNGDYYWWGGNLQGVADRPVDLAVDNKVVYSPHDYPASVYAQPWFYNGSNLYEVFDDHWGYIHEQGIAPILLGEFGSKLATSLDQKWAEAITRYLSGDYDGNGAVDAGGRQMNFAWWSWNPNSGDTGGVLLDDWRTPRPAVVDLLDDLLDAPAGPVGTAGSVLTFDVALSKAATSNVVLDYKTANGTATAGSDYEAASGTLTFTPGQTVKTVTVKLIGDTTAEANETLFLDVTGSIGSGRARGTIVNDDGTPPPSPTLPSLTIADATFDEAAGKAIIAVSLSAPSTGEVKVNYSTAAGTALAGSDFTAASGTLTFAANQTTRTISVDLVNDTAPEAQEQFDLVLSNPLGATIADGRATVRITDTDVAAPPADDVTVSAKITNRWSTGTQVAVKLFNDGDVAINGWEVEFNAPAPIKQVFGGILTGRSGEVEVDNVSSNALIGPNKSVSFSFIANDGRFDFATWLKAADFDFIAG